MTYRNTSEFIQSPHKQQINMGSIIYKYIKRNKGKIKKTDQQNQTTSRCQG